MSSKLIQIRSLEKTFVSEGVPPLTILKDVSIDIAEGSKTVIVGESGSGKSTLLNIIAGLDSATAGTVRCGGYDVTAMAEEGMSEYRSAFLGLIFQFHYLLKDFTALENVLLPALMAGTPQREARSRAQELLGAVGLSRRADHLPAELSGGERQRVAVARSLINNPSLILADEPTGNLDPANAAAIADLLFSMADTYRKTLVLITHDRGIARRGSVCYTIRDRAVVPFSAEEL